MLIDVSMPIRQGDFFRYGIQPVEIKKATFHNEIDGQYEATIISMPAHTATHIDLVFDDRNVEIGRMIGRGKLFDVRGISDRVITLSDIENRALVKAGDFVFFRTGWDEFAQTDRYFEHPEISREVLEWLVSKRVNGVGIDTMGLARDPLHGEYDRFLAKNDIYVIENLYNLGAIPSDKLTDFTVYCFPLSIRGVDAIPARVVVEVKKDSQTG